MSLPPTIGLSSDPGTAITLKSVYDWDRWITNIQFHAQIKGIWHHINPDAEDTNFDPTIPPTHPTRDLAIDIVKARHAKEFAESERDYNKADPLTRNELPVPKLLSPTEAQINEEYADLRRNYTSALSTWTSESNRYTTIFEYVGKTVDSSLMERASTQLVQNNQTTLQALLKILKREISPAKSVTQTAIRQQYQSVLVRAQNSGVTPRRWFNDWNQAYLRAKTAKIPDIEGVLGIKNFLQAIQYKIAPEWARGALAEVIKDEHLGNEPTSLDQYGKIFSGMILENELASTRKGPSVFATLGSQKSGQNQGQQSQNSGGAPTGGSTKRGERCPCRKEVSQTHPWSPETCGILEYAVTGSTDRPIRVPTQEELEEIRKRWKHTRWEELRQKIADEGWKVKRASYRPRNNNRSYPAPNMTFTVIDPSLLGQGVFTTIGFEKHMLSDSTLLDNCGALHVVNSSSLLEPGSFALSKGYDSIHAGSSEFPISGRGTRIIRNVLAGPKGQQTVDMVLTNVALVEGFHANIVAEARLYEKGIWYCGKDCSLRYGDMGNSVTLAKLTRRHNLVFLEYKPLSQYSDRSLVVLSHQVPEVIPVSAAGLIAAGSYTRAFFKPTVDPPKPRADTARLWHLRTGHLGPRALQALAYRGRNVQFADKAIARIECEACARTYASQKISRRPSENKSARPFWRILWDLFDYSMGYDGSKWLLAIKDEYSGMLWTYTLPEKTVGEVYGSIRDFERWVMRRYRLPIAIIRHDNERSVIAMKGETEYVRWLRDTGITLELPPAYTKEPVGGSERAGKEIITKGIALLHGAGLPEKLWPEAVHAAAWLYNRSPSQNKNYHAPCEVLENWFRQYFRWYTPERVRALTSDLRPDWSFAYAYGCRAYPLEKDRTAAIDRRSYKSRVRAHIGYLVGYRASNLYRVWIPQLEEVITTRDVTFDEEKFYSDNTDRQPIEIERQIADQIRIDPTPDVQAEDDEVWEHEGLVSREPPAITADEVDGAPQPSEEPTPTTTTEKHESGVGAADQPQRGLMTPQPTPEPESRDTGEAQSSHTGAGAPPSVGADRTTGNNNSDSRLTPQNPAKRKYNKKTHPPATRASRRMRGQDPDDGAGGGGGVSAFVFTTIIYTKDEISLPTHSSWTSFLETFFPDQLEAVNEGDRAHTTLHAVFAAAVHQIKPERFNTTTKPIHRNDLIKPPPKNWNDLATHPLGARFKENAIKEMQSMKDNLVLKIIPTDQNTDTPLPLKWVFTYKFDDSGFLDVCKSRMVVRGDLQNADTLQSTYAATLAAKSFRLMTALIAQFDLEALQFDVATAFLNASRKDEQPVTTYLPEGFKQPNKVMLLKRALYGLKDSPLLWYKEFSNTLRRFGMISSAEEPCLFYNKARTVFLIFYVDDFIIAFDKQYESQAQKLIADIKGAYEIKEQGVLAFFLGIRVIRDRKAKTVTLVHDQYIEKIAARYGLADDSWTPSTPLPYKEFTPYTGQASKASIKAFQERIGSILYTAIMIRLDVAFAVSQLSKFLTNPSPDHMAAAVQVLRYLYAHRYLGIRYGQEHGAQALMIAGDASFADDVETRRSSHGYIMSLFGGAICWKATRQSTVATSTTEAELTTIGLTGRESMGLTRLFRDIQLDLGQDLIIHSDNKQAIRLVVGEQEKISTKLRHVDIQNMWARQEHQKGSFKLEYLPTSQMPADGLTKNLTRAQFEHFRALINLHDTSSQVTGEKSSKAGKQDFESIN